MFGVPQEVIQPAFADALTFPGRLSSEHMMPLEAVTFRRWSGSVFWLLRSSAKEEEKESKGAEAGDPQSASAVVDSSGAVQDEAAADWTREGEEEEEQEAEGGSNTRSCGVAALPHPEPLGVFPRVKQKPADLKWWVGGVHQIALWVGAARRTQLAKARAQQS